MQSYTHNSFRFYFLLLKAVVGGNARVAEVLLRAGADVNAKDNTEKTALMVRKGLLIWEEIIALFKMRI